MFWLQVACISKPDPETTDNIDPGGITTSDTGSDTATGSTLTDGWSSIRLEQVPFGRILSDGADSWAVTSDGGVMRPGDPWQALGNEPFADGSLRDASAGGGILWALTFTELQQFDGSSWSATALPEALQDAGVLVTRADGTIAVLRYVQSSDEDCYTGDCLPAAANILGLWDGSDWSVYETGPDEALEDLTEMEDGSLVAVGSSGWVARWDGADWEDLYRGGGNDWLRAVTTYGDEIIAVGDSGLVVRGSLGSLVASQTLDGVSLSAIDAADDGTIWALSYGAAHLDDGGWSEVSLPEGGWAGIAATAEGAWIVGDQAGPTALAVDPAGFEIVWHEASLFWVQDAYVAADDTVWFAAYNSVGRWGAAGLDAWGTLSTLSAISGGSADDVVAVGTQGIFQWNGEGFDLVYPLGDGNLWDVSVAPDGSAFVAAGLSLPDESEVPAMLRRDGGVWSIDETPIPTIAGDLINIIAFASDDVYALTWNEITSLLHFDGVSWTDLTGDLGPDYEVLWGRSGSDLYIGKAGDSPGPSLLHFDGAALSEVGGAPPYIRGIAGTEDALLVSATDGWGSEFSPSIAMWRDSAWIEMVRSDDFLTVGGAGATAVIVDGSTAQRGPSATW